ncbi:MAG: EpsG family protein [Marmoricola sp.]
MTVYWVTIALVGYLLWMARLVDPALNEHPMGRFSTKPLARLLILAAALVLMLVAALRWRVGTDFYQYILNYTKYKSAFLVDLRAFNEPGIRGVAWLVSKIHDDPVAFIATSSILTIGLMLWTITRYSIAIPMSYILFVFVGSWHGTFNGVRQFMAAAIILAGHRFIINRKPIHFLLIILLATSFHLSAVTMLPLYLLPNRRLRPAMFVLMAGIALALLLSSNAVLVLISDVKGDLVFNDYTATHINSLRIAAAVAPVGLYFTYAKRTELDHEWFYRNIIVVNAVVMVAAAWSAYLGRFTIYTLVFLPLALPRLIDFSDRKVTTLVRAMAVLLYGLFWYVDVSKSADLNHFQFIFDQPSGSLP